MPPTDSTPLSTAAPIRVPVIAWLAAFVALGVVYLLLQENGLLVTAQMADYIHEFTHDGRHALGVPCH